DLGAGLVGGISNVSGTLEGAGDVVVFEAIHGIADHLAGKGVANPLTFIRAAVELLRHIGEATAADRIEGAIAKALLDGVKTGDLGGTTNTEGFIDGVIARLG
ncbi:MAG TPA: isocitrate/isopropylmalate family dehydrogenase, partial [Myxococcota bacterium]|nr:isocitrate/isopropylmalate family dehydrogenase [Myxococcota bacterium]